VQAATNGFLLEEKRVGLDGATTAEVLCAITTTRRIPQRCGLTDGVKNVANRLAKIILFMGSGTPTKILNYSEN